MKKGIDFIGIAIVFLCHDGKGNILVEKRSMNARDEKGRWGPGGGGLKFGERIEEGLGRELKEEYGVEALEHEFLGFRDVHREQEGAKTHWITLDFIVRIDPEKARNTEPEMRDEIRWVRLEELPEPRHSQFPPFLEQYRERFSRL